MNKAIRHNYNLWQEQVDKIKKFVEKYRKYNLSGSELARLAIDKLSDEQVREYIKSK